MRESVQCCTHILNQVCKTDRSLCDGGGWLLAVTQIGWSGGFTILMPKSMGRSNVPQCTSTQSTISMQQRQKEAGRFNVSALG